MARNDKVLEHDLAVQKDAAPKDTCRSLSNSDQKGFSGDYTTMRVKSETTPHRRSDLFV